MIHPPPCYFWNSTKCIRTISWLCAKNRLLAAHKAKVCVLQQEGKWHLGLSSSVCTVGLSLHRVKNSAREINKKEGGREDNLVRMKQHRNKADGATRNQPLSQTTAILVSLAVPLTRDHSFMVYTPSEGQEGHMIPTCLFSGFLSPTVGN